MQFGGVVRRVLVTLPNHIPNVVAWLLDYASELRLSGAEVYLLDLAWCHERYVGKASRVLVDSLSYQHGIDGWIRGFCRDHGLELIRTRRVGAFQASAGVDEHTEAVFQTALRSTWAMHFGTSQISLDLLAPTVIERSRMSFNSVVKVVQDQLADGGQFDAVVTSNGRFIIDAATVLSARMAGIPIEIVERSPATLGKYCVFRTSPHSMREWQTMVDDYWAERSGDVAALAQARRLLDARVSTTWEWTKLQERAHVSSVERGADPFVSFFPTSEWEFSPFGDEPGQGEEFRTQLDAFIASCEVAAAKGLRVVVRGHPQPGEPTAAAREDALWSARCAERGAEYIPCNSPVSSLGLAAQATFSVSYISSIAVDIAHLGHPVVVLAPTPFSHLVPEISTFTRSALERFAEDPYRLESERLLPWAMLEAAGGKDLRHFTVRAYNDVDLGGRAFMPERLWVLGMRSRLSTVRRAVIGWVNRFR